MDTQMILVYCLCDELLKALNHREDPQCQLGDAEVMTIAVVAALHYGGHYAQACRFLGSHGYLRPLSRSRFSRRLHRIQRYFGTLIALLAQAGKALNAEQTYVVDTFPVPVCDNIRIRRCKLYQGEAYRGFIASKKRYFYGLKVHLLIAATGAPIEFFLTPGSCSDTRGLLHFDFDLPPGAKVIGDKAYNLYGFEDLLAEVGIELKPIRKKNSQRAFEPWMRYWQACVRKRIETAVSLIEQVLPKSIHATTAAGFELKVVLFILACSIQLLPLP